MTAANILQNALGHMLDRAATYDKPDGERSMGATVTAFQAVTGVGMTEEQGWLFMALLKAVRSQQGAFSADSYEDGAAYFALAGESACIDRNGAWDAEAIKSASFPASFGQQNMIDPADVEIVEDPLACSGCMSGCYRCCPGLGKIAAEKLERMRANPVHPTSFVEVASEIDDESPRADAIGQNGNDGEVYVHYGMDGNHP